jgi:flagellar protein FlgJ
MSAMSISPTDPQAYTPAYTDLAGLSALKRGAANHDPATIRKVAEQFESMFTRMMLKSMREAVGPDPMFGSDQEQMYQSMADDQLSVQLSKGRGMGLADMLIRQLQKMGVPGAAADTSSGTQPSTKGAAAYSATQRVPMASAAVQGNFIQSVLQQAQEAGQQLGVSPTSLIAQAALETNWGQNLPQDAAGRSSNNLFGMKASAGWTGTSVAAGTQEYQGGEAMSTTSQFRAYANPAQSFQDYVSLLRNTPRYAAALNTGSDVQAFAAGLQRGGYATDPDYARKITAIAHHISASAASGANGPDLKVASALPITSNTETL